MSPTTDLLGFGEGREEGPHQQKDGGGTEMLEHGPPVIICGSHATCTPTWCHGRSGGCGTPPGTGTLLCVIGSVCGFTFSDEV